VRLAEGRRYVGVEPDGVSAEVARARLRRLGVAGEIRVGDVSAVEPNEQFDLVCAFEVIEHIEDDGAFVRGCARHVRPGGTLLLTTPAGESRFGIADEMVGHYRRYEAARLDTLLTGAALQPVSVTHYGAPFAYVLELVRTSIARALRRRTREQSAAERTAVSGRLMQPGDGSIALIHKGTCDSFTSTPAYYLSAFDADGTSATAVKATVDKLTTGGYVVVIHESLDDLTKAYACGVIG